ncbi:MAG TPA: hypothetical protein VFL91_32205 [Thermomicrobiales bacterium]|nr:hypothetical protein [Thermomicrobiales bacterium]
MGRTIPIVWWVGLVGALVATVVAVKEIALVLRALRDIERLAVLTRDAARGVAANLAPLRRLAEVDGPAGEIRAGTGTLAAAAATVERKLDAVAAEAAGAAPRGDAGE